MNGFDLAGTPCLVFEPESLNAFESIEMILALTFKEESLEAYIFKQSSIPSPWNLYWTDIAREGGGLDISHSVFHLQKVKLVSKNGLHSLILLHVLHK